MARDEHGLEMTATSAAAVAHYDRAVDELLHFRPAMLDEATAAAREEPALPMAAALGAYLRLLSTEPADAADARRLLAEFRSVAAGRQFLAREDKHLRAAEAWATGDIHGAGRLLRSIAREHPRDALALSVGHQIDFFTGDALRSGTGSPRRSAPGPSSIRIMARSSGMLAFGLEEAGEYERAEETGRRAVERDAQTSGASTPSPTATRCAHESSTGSGTSKPGRPTGATAMRSPCTTGGTARCSRSRRGTSRRSDASTTRASITRTRPGSR